MQAAFNIHADLYAHRYETEALHAPSQRCQKCAPRRHEMRPAESQK